MFPSTRARSGQSVGWVTGAAAVLLVCLSTDCPAGDAPLETPQTAGKKTADNQLLLLISGRIIEGRISQTAGGYMVEMPKGSVLIPFGQVRFEAADRREAYRKLRKTMPVRTASRHIALARWCLSQDLLPEARRELAEALKLEPNRREARSMLRRLAKGVSPKKPSRRSPLARDDFLSRPGQVTGDPFASPQARSLANLSRDSANEYVTKIQPILMNKCALAGCHAPRGPSELRLTRVRVGRGSHRVFSERNLAVVMRYLDAKQPQRSPLLVVPQGAHGGETGAIFHGTRGADQLATLAAWVRQAAVSKQEKNAETAGPGEKTFPQEPRVRPTELSSRPSAEGGGGLTSPASASDARSAEPGEQELRDLILRSRRDDPFDPEIFNRAVHGDKRDKGHGANGVLPAGDAKLPAGQIPVPSAAQKSEYP